MSGREQLRVIFLNRFYWPDVAATAQMLTDLAEDLAKRGWSVTVVVSRSTYNGTSVMLPAEECRNGVRIYRTSVTRFGRHNLAGRVADYVSYLMGTLIHVLRLPKHDVIVAMSDPPLVVALAVLAARLRGWISVYWVQDLFPQIAGALQVLPPRGIVYRLVNRVAHWANHKADLVVTLGPRMADRMMQSGARAGRVTFVHNWADASAIKPIPNEDNPFVLAHGLKGRFVVLYSGNAGRAHRFDGVMDAARLLRDDPRIVFLFIGSGKLTPELKREAAESELENVWFLDYVSRDELAQSLSSASISLVTEDPAVVGLLVPSKTYGILASGRPIIFMGDEGSDVASVVREAECGLVLAPDDGTGLRDSILALRDDPARLATLGANARRAAESLYDRRLATRKWAVAVESQLAWRRG